MDKYRMVEQINMIYRNYEEHFHNICDYDNTISYREYNLFRQNEDLYLVLENVSGITPSHDLKIYCKIPKTENELKELMKELGYIEDKSEQMDINTLKLIYKHLEDRLEFIEKNKPKSKSIVGMELACQIIFELMIEGDK